MIGWRKPLQTQINSEKLTNNMHNKRMLSQRKNAALLGRLTLRFSRPKCER